jgi:probable F420-dependent oxidoreductase
MKFTIQLPVSKVEPVGEFQTGEAIRAVAQAIEASGADACCVDDHPIPDIEWLRDKSGHDAIDPFVALSFAAAATTRLHVHTNILVLPYRNPFLTAKAVASLEALSGGRLILGMGSGYLEGEFRALGIDFAKRGALMDEAVETMKLAWSGEVVVKTGRNFEARGNLARPTPATPPTLWFGGAADKVLDRVVKWGAGWCPHFGAPVKDQFRRVQGAIHSMEDLRERVDELNARLAAAGREDPVDVCINLPQPPRSMDRATAEATVDTIEQLKKSGATWVFTVPDSRSRSAYLESTDWFGREIIAHFRD